MIHWNLTNSLQIVRIRLFTEEILQQQFKEKMEKVKEEFSGRIQGATEADMEAVEKIMRIGMGSEEEGVVEGAFDVAIFSRRMRLLQYALEQLHETGT